MISIAVAADRRFEKQLAVALSSLAASQDDPYEVFVMQRDYDSASRRRVEAVARPRTTNWVDLGLEPISQLPVAAHTAPASSFRLLLPSVIPTRVRRLIYLDCDLLVRRPLGPLWEVALEGRALAGVRDAKIPWAGAPGALPWCELGIRPTAPYLNAGVMLIDLDQWRGADVQERALSLTDRHRLRYADQCAVNVLFSGCSSLVHPRWNLQVGHLVADESRAWLVEDRDELDAALADPGIVHFNTGSLGRPWLLGCTHPFREEWYEALDSTPWSGWRPSARQEAFEALRRPDVLARLRHRVRLAARVLAQAPG